MELILMVAIGLFLAYANGANDNFKGVATILGSGTASYRTSIVLATVTTLAGSLTAIVAARGLLAAFSGKGLVPPEVVGDPQFAVSVALAAAVTVMAATRLGFPISTTHALIGGLVGAGIVASPSGIQATELGATFVFPLLLTPLISATMAGLAYLLLKRAGRRMIAGGDTCLCAGTDLAPIMLPGDGTARMSVTQAVPMIAVGNVDECGSRFEESFLRIRFYPLVSAAHYLSAGAVSFARGLNDTPKIAALLLAGGALSPSTANSGIAAAMAIGGLISARRVAESMSHRITTLDPKQGLVGNLVTSAVVLVASRFGVPASTTHVSCGALFGIGAANGHARWGTIFGILLAWVITLPVAAILGALAFGVLGHSLFN